jgi:hypothetical protein
MILIPIIAIVVGAAFVYYMLRDHDPGSWVIVFLALTVPIVVYILLSVH